MKASTDSPSAVPPFATQPESLLSFAKDVRRSSAANSVNEPLRETEQRTTRTRESTVHRHDTYQNHPPTQTHPISLSPSDPSPPVDGPAKARLQVTKEQSVSQSWRPQHNMLASQTPAEASSREDNDDSEPEPPYPSPTTRPSRLSEESSHQPAPLNFSYPRPTLPDNPYQQSHEDVSSLEKADERSDDDATPITATELPSPTPGLSTRVGVRRPMRLNINTVREAEARGSLSSLSDLIARAARLATNLESGRTASRLGMDWLGDDEGDGGEERGDNRRATSRLSEMMMGGNKEWAVGDGDLWRDDDVAGEGRGLGWCCCCYRTSRKRMAALLMLVFVVVAAAIAVTLVLVLRRKGEDS